MRNGWRDILGAWAVVAGLGGGLAVAPYVSGLGDTASGGVGVSFDGMISVPRNTGWQPDWVALGLPAAARMTLYANEDVPAWARGMTPMPTTRDLAATGADEVRVCLALSAANGAAASGN